MDVMVQERTQENIQTTDDQVVNLSIVCVISDRHDDLREIFLQHVQEISSLTLSFEWIFVVDGPETEVIEELKSLKPEHQEIQVLVLNRWVGEATALAVGFERAKGTIILTIPSYFQVQPSEIHVLMNKLTEEDFDLVIPRRYPRADSLLNRLPSRIFHWLAKVLTGAHFHDLGCGMRAIKRKTVDEVHLYGDLHRFLPMLAHQRGFKVVEVDVKQSQHDMKARLYTPGTYLRRLIDILSLFFLLRFTKKPLRFFGLVGSSLLGSGALITAYLGMYRLLGFGAIADRPLLLLGVLLMVLGIQLFSIGLLGELIIFTHAREHQDYQIDEILA